MVQIPRVSKAKHPHILFWLLLLLLSSCESSNIEMLPALDSSTSAFPEGQGLLVIQIADTTPTGQRFPVNQLTIAAKDVNETGAKLQRLVSVDGFGRSTQLFTALLPANEYSIASLRVFYQFGDAYFTRFYPGDIELGTFRIEPGTTTNLGLLGIFIDRAGEDYKYSTSRLADAANQEQVLKKISSELLDSEHESTNILSWNADGSSRDRQNMYRRATNRQIVYGTPYIESNSDAISYPTRLGMIVQRDTEGLWGLDAFDKDVELRFLTRIGNASLVITEFNEVYRRQDGNSNWVKTTNPVGDSDTVGNMVYIGPHPQGGIVGVTQQSNSATLWSAQDYDQEWQQRAHLVPKLGFFESFDPDHPSIERKIQGSQYISNKQYLFLALKDDLYRYEFATDAMTKLKVPKVGSLQIRNDIITLTTDSAFGTDKASFDTGESWKNYRGGYTGSVHPNTETRRQAAKKPPPPRAKLIGHPIFVSNDAGYAIHASRRKSEQPFLIKTIDQGSTWQSTDSELPQGCVDLEIATSKGLLLRCFLSGEFYHSTDEGNTWELDREVSET